MCVFYIPQKPSVGEVVVDTLPIDIVTATGPTIMDTDMDMAAEPTITITTILITRKYLVLSPCVAVIVKDGGYMTTGETVDDDDLSIVLDRETPERLYYSFCCIHYGFSSAFKIVLALSKLNRYK